jgi:recombination protein RecT
MKELVQKFSTSLAAYEKKVLAELLKQHAINPAQFVQIVLTEVKRSPKMMEAFQNNPSSLFASIIYCAQLGLSPSEMSGEFYFIPFKGMIKPVIGYKGIVALMTRNKAVSMITAESVHGNDIFEYELGLEPKLVHKPISTIRNSKNLTHIYVIAKLENGEKVFKVMSVDEIKSVMNTMKEVNTLYFNDAKDPMLWMPKKTCIKQLSKLLPKDYYGSQALGMDDKIEGGAYLILDEDGKIQIQEDLSGTIRSSSSGKTNIYATLNTNVNPIENNLNIENNGLILPSEETPNESSVESKNDNNDNTTTVRIVKQRKGAL